MPHGIVEIFAHRVFPLSDQHSIGTARWLAGFGRHRRLVVRATVCLNYRMLDPSECERARVARDRRYDGRFFTGVRTTKIYCRPVCPVRPAQAKNVTFFPSAAAAEAAGFRPCLRCRPETAPFSSMERHANDRGARAPDD